MTLKIYRSLNKYNKKEIFFRNNFKQLHKYKIKPFLDQLIKNILKMTQTKP